MNSGKKANKNHPVSDRQSIGVPKTKGNLLSSSLSIVIDVGPFL
ncbi:Protein of unknown function [Leuconostoc citreum LBAE C11]|nr:Protein of unknown function [Leuconostoc citreum LBAE C11]